jgi:transcriptional regulator with XRE-family HTH domain
MQANETQIARRLGQAVRRHRQARGWSQATLAEQLDVSVDYIGLLERGERLPAIGTLVAMAGALGATPNEFLLQEGDGSTWDAQALALLRSVPQAIQPVVLAMLRAAIGAPDREAPKRRARRRTRS